MSPNGHLSGACMVLSHRPRESLPQRLRAARRRRQDFHRGPQEWAMKSGITWRRTFPECEPGTDGVALFEGRIIGRVRLMTELPHDPKPWVWSVTDPDLAGRAGLERHAGETGSRRQAIARVIERW